MSVISELHKNDDPMAWQRFFGNNHEWMDPPKIVWGGGVSFKEHLGKPLSQELWTDLRHRMKMRRCRIYRPGVGEWTDGQLSHSAIIHLDEADLVADIHWYP